ELHDRLLRRRSRYGAHFAHRLRQDEIRVCGPQSIRIDDVHASMLIHGSVDSGIDFGARESLRLEARPTESRLVEHVWGIVAFMGDAHDSVAEAECAYHFRRGGQE